MNRRTDDMIHSVPTVKELAALLRIGINNAYQLVRDGTIRSVRVGRQYRVPRRAVDEYLENNFDGCA